MNETNPMPEPPRLLPCFLPASDDGLSCNAIMLCEMIGDEIQSISLRVAADPVGRWREAPLPDAARRHDRQD